MQTVSAIMAFSGQRRRYDSTRLGGEDRRRHMQWREQGSQELCLDIEMLANYEVLVKKMRTDPKVLENLRVGGLGARRHLEPSVLHGQRIQGSHAVTSWLVNQSADLLSTCSGGASGRTPCKRGYRTQRNWDRVCDQSELGRDKGGAGGRLLRGMLENWRGQSWDRDMCEGGTSGDLRVRSSE